MAVNLYGARKIIARTLGNNQTSERATLVKVTVGAVPAATPEDGGVRTTDRYPCRVLKARKATAHGTQAQVYGQQGNSNRRDESATIQVLGGSLPSGVVPLAGDDIEVGGKVYRVAGDVGTDEAEAVYACPCRYVGPVA